MGGHGNSWGPSLFCSPVSTTRLPSTTPTVAENEGLLFGESETEVPGKEG